MSNIQQDNPAFPGLERHLKQSQEMLAAVEIALEDGSSPEQCADAISAIDAFRETLTNLTNDIAQKKIPEYHWLDFRVGRCYLWICHKSPVGTCVYPIDHKGVVDFDHCIFCGEPNERK